MKRKIKGAVVVVTGASSGIGKATAVLLAEKGANLVLAARRDEPLEELAQVCRNSGVQAKVVVADVSDPEACRHLADVAVDTFGKVDAWVNNAGVYAMGTVEETPDAVFERVMDVNYLGYVYCTRAILPTFRSQGRGVFVNIDSAIGRVSGPYLAAYSASKFAVRGFSEALRDELRGSGIDVCVIYPPSIDTPLFQHSANFTGKVITPAEPVYPPEKVAGIIVDCIKHPQREVVIGAGKGFSMFHTLAPGLFERVMTRQVEKGHFADEPAPTGEGNLFAPDAEGTGASGGWKRRKTTRRIGKALLLVAPIVLPLAARKLGYKRLARSLELFKPALGALNGLRS